MNNKPSDIFKNGWTIFNESRNLNEPSEVGTFLADEENIKSLFKNLGVKNPRNLKLTAYLPCLSYTLFFNEGKNEYLIPLDDISWNGKSKYKVYRASEYINKLQNVIKYSKDNKLGTTLDTTKFELKEENLKSNPILFIILCLFICFIVTLIIYKTIQNKKRSYS